MKKLISTLIIIVCSQMMFSQNFWTQKTNLTGLARYRATGLSIGNKGYFAMGDIDAIPNNTDLWEYDAAGNYWTQKADFPGSARNNICAWFSINGKGYMGCGSRWVPGLYTNYNDFWMYNPATNTWTAKATFPGSGRRSAVSFTIGECGYMVSGITQDGIYLNETWEYNSTTDTWTQKASIGSTGRVNAVGFAIGRMGYFGLGTNSSNAKLSDFWQYDQANNTWTQKNNFSGGTRTYMSGTSVGSYGYIGFGVSNSSDYCTDFWMYNPSSDTWVQKTGLTTGRNQAAIFELGGKVYVGTGYGGTRLQDLWEYTPEGYGIDDVADNNFDIKYQSENHKITIEGVEINHVAIYSISGQRITSQNFANENHVSIDVGKISSGIYFVAVVSKTKLFSRKLLLTN